MQGHWRKLEQEPLKSMRGVVLGMVRLYHDPANRDLTELPYIVVWQLDGGPESVQARFRHQQDATKMLVDLTGAKVGA